MTSLLVEQLEEPANEHYVHALDTADERVGDVLAGRTVWCATSVPRTSRAAERLRSRIDAGGGGGAAATLHIGADEQLRELATRVDGMLGGGRRQELALGRAEHEAYARASLDEDALSGASVAHDDVVVVHDALSAIAIEAVRERGAHAAWRIELAGTVRPSAREALEFIRRLTPGIDAFVVCWLERGPRGETVESVGALMPSAGIVAAKKLPTRFRGEQPRRLAWRMALAEVVRSDRGECVGGTLRPRPTVAAR